jgi:hypothetical protein
MPKLGKRSSHALNGNWARNLYFLEIDVDADASAGISILAPFDLVIADVIVECRATNASGDLQVRTGTTAISDAIACDTDEAITRAGSIVEAAAVVDKNGDINALSAGGTAADTRGLVTLVVKRLGD